MRNIFTQGTAGAHDVEHFFTQPTNEDYALVGEVTAYNAALAKITVRKIWDLGTTDFYVWARYENASGRPSAEEIEIGTWLPFFRVGVGNLDFTEIPTGPQLHNTEATYYTASFVAFFVKEAV